MKVEILIEDQAVKGYDYPIEIKIYEGGTQLVPSAATLTVKDPDGAKIKDAVSMSIDTAGTMAYTVPAADLGTLWENAVLELLYTLSSVQYKAIFLFDVVLNALKCNVIDEDLKAYAPQLAGSIWDDQVNYDTQIQEAFRQVKRMIKDKGRRPSLIMDGSQIRELVILKTFEMIFFSFAKSQEDVWWGRFLNYNALFKERFEALRFKYDEDESGTIEEDERATLGQTFLVR